MAMSYKLSRALSFLRLPPSVQWRAYLVRLPWLVPLPVLHYTSPGGPYPTVLELPSRGKHTIPVFVFRPSKDPPSPGTPGIHLDFHGGGFIMGSCLEQAPWCAQLARTTGRIVLSVDYRKGPLDRFPAAIEDSEDVLAAVLDSEGKTPAGRALRKCVGVDFDHEDVSLSGFSSGGNLALNLVLSVETEIGKWPSLFKETGPPIPTLLFYPSLDCRQLPHERPRPAKMAAKGDSSSWFPDIGSVLGPTYLPHDMRAHPRASPGLNDMRECLSKRARIRLILPEVDTLAHQSEVWVQKMREEGQDDEQRLKVVREEDMVHGWTQFPDAWLEKRALDRKRAVLGEAAAWVSEVRGEGERTARPGVGNIMEDNGVLVDL